MLNVKLMAISSQASYFLLIPSQKIGAFLHELPNIHCPQLKMLIVTYSCSTFIQLLSREDSATRSLDSHILSLCALSLGASWALGECETYKGKALSYLFGPGAPMVPRDREVVLSLETGQWMSKSASQESRSDGHHLTCLSCSLGTNKEQEQMR